MWNEVAVTRVFLYFIYVNQIRILLQYAGIMYGVSKVGFLSKRPTPLFFEVGRSAHLLVSIFRKRFWYSLYAVATQARKLFGSP